MLEIAQKCKEELEEKMLDIWYNDKYMYWNSDIYFEKFTVDDNTWDKHQFVVINETEHGDELVGYIGYNVNRSTNNCYDLNAINFSECSVDKRIFGYALGLVLQDIFEKFHFNKLNFCVVNGNPIEESYDKTIERFGGRIVGYFENEVKLYDGTYHDMKLYEITSEQYFNSVHKSEKESKR